MGWVIFAKIVYRLKNPHTSVNKIFEGSGTPTLCREIMDIENGSGYGNSYFSNEGGKEIQRFFSPIKGFPGATPNPMRPQQTDGARQRGSAIKIFSDFNDVNKIKLTEARL